MDKEINMIIPHRLSLWICAWLELIDAVLCILSFTLIRTSFSYRYVVWDSIRMAKLKQKERDKIMKYYILTQYHIEDSEVIGIYSSHAKAVEYLKSYYPSLKLNLEFKTYIGGMRNGWEIVFEITEHTLDDMSMNKELIFPNHE